MATRDLAGVTGVRAFSSQNGALLWGPVTVGGDRGAALALEGGRVYCVDSSGTIRALNAADGSQLWSKTPWNYADAPPIAQNGRVYAGISSVLRCFDGADGTVVWSRTDSNSHRGAPALDASGLYVPHGYPETFKLNADTGALLWQSPRLSSGASSRAYTPVLHNGKLYTRDYPETVIDTGSGAYIGTLPLGTAPVFASTSNGEIAVTATNAIGMSGAGNLRGLDAATGTEKWKFTGDGTLYSAPVLLDGVLYAASTSGNIYAIDPATGTALWSKLLGANVANTDEHNSSLHLFGLGAGDGLLVVPAKNRLIALQKYSGADTQAPTLTIENIAHGGLVNKLGTLGGVATDDVEGIALMTLKLTRLVDGSNTAQAFNGNTWQPYSTLLRPALINGRWSYSSIAADASLSTGNYSIILSATDNLGRTNTISSNFRVDVTPPTADLTQPEAFTKVLGQLSGPITDSGGSLPGSMQITLFRDTGCSTSTSGVCGDYWNGSTWVAAASLAAPPKLTAVVDLPKWYYWAPQGTSFGNVEARYTVTMYPADRLGNTIGEGGFGPPARSFLLDATPPSGAFTAPISGSYVQALPVATGTATDALSGVGTHFISLRGPLGYWTGYTWNNTSNPLFLPTDIPPYVPGGTTSTSSVSTWKYSSLPTGANAPDGSYTYGLRVKDKVGNIFYLPVSDQPTVILDTTAPRIVWGAANPAANTRGWHKSAVTIPFTAQDEASGIQSIDPASSSVVIDGESSGLVATASATDGAGNTGSGEFRCNIDKTAPKTTAQFSNSPSSNGTFTGDATVTLAADDALSGVLATYFRLDAGPVQLYKGPITVTGDGEHRLEFWSVDNADNEEGAQVLALSIDSTPPVSTLSLSGTRGQNDWFTGPVTVSLGSSEAGATYFRLDGGASRAYTAPFIINSEGSYTLEFYSEDRSGNQEVAQIAPVKIDFTPPTLNASAVAVKAAPTQGKKPVRSSVVEVEVSGSTRDALSDLDPTGATYSVVDEYGQVQPSGTFTVSDDGSFNFNLTLNSTTDRKDRNGRSYTITLRSRDRAGNQASTVVPFTAN